MIFKIFVIRFSGYLQGSSWWLQLHLMSTVGKRYFLVLELTSGFLNFLFYNFRLFIKNVKLFIILAA